MEFNFRFNFIKNILIAARESRSSSSIFTMDKREAAVVVVASAICASVGDSKDNRKVAQVVVADAVEVSTGAGANDAPELVTMQQEAPAQKEVEPGPFFQAADATTPAVPGEKKNNPLNIAYAIEV